MHKVLYTAGYGLCRIMVYFDTMGIKRLRIPRVGFRSLYLAMLLGWLALTVLSLLVVVTHARSRVAQEFDHQATATFHELRTKLRANEAAISSFASFLGAVEVDDKETVATFAATLKGSYPHIHRLEVLRKVARNERAAFESYMRSNYDVDFRIGNFSHDNGRQRASVRDKGVYYPLIFMWPEIPEAKSVFGLDMDSIPHLQQAVLAADATSQTVTSRPFLLVEGGQGYAIFRSVREQRTLAQRRFPSFSGALQAVLIIRADDLVPAQVLDGSSYRISINGTGQNNPLLLEVASQVASQPGANFWLPREVLNFEDDSPLQPLKLNMERQMLWSDISFDGLMWTGCISLITLIVLLVYLRQHHRRLIDSDFHVTRTQFLAMHDPLTALPNRLLFNERLKFQLGKWRHRGESFGLMFIDLDLFKSVNDEFGHRGGDRVLVEVARRLRACVHEADTLARLGGDKFVVLVEQVRSHEHLLLIAQQVLANISEPFQFEGNRVVVTASIGISACPEDGVDADTLIHRADMSMYVVKQRGRNGVMGLNRNPGSGSQSGEAHLQLVK